METAILLEYLVLALVAMAILIHISKYLPEARRERFDRIILVEVKEKKAIFPIGTSEDRKKVFRLLLKPIDLKILVYGCTSNIEVQHFTNERYYNTIEVGDFLKYDFGKKEIMQNFGKEVAE